MKGENRFKDSGNASLFIGSVAPSDFCFFIVFLAVPTHVLYQTDNITVSVSDCLTFNYPLGGCWLLPKWKKGETEFIVALNPTSGTHDCKIPKPIVERLGNPGSLKFSLRGKNIVVTSGEE